MRIFWWGTVILGTSFLILWVRACELTLIKGDYYYRWAEENRLRKIELVSPRGRILTKEGRVLADNVVLYNDPQGHHLERQEALLRQQKGEEVVSILKRRYPLGEKAAHLTGYLGKAEAKELAQERCPAKALEYQADDWVGRGGLEAEYDCFLVGKPGKKLVEVNSRGQVVREIGQIEPEPGDDLLTTIDFDLQQFVFQQLKGKKGAVVVLQLPEASVLALVSWPSFDPNVFNFQRDEAKIRHYLQDEEGMPFLNRVISGAYHPGSVFKPVVALAALEEGKVSAETLIEDTGVIKVGEWQFSNWYWNQYGRTEGKVDLVKALKRSNDIYFYKIGEWLGAEKITHWAHRFGLGELTGIDLPGESRGLVPSPEWKKEVKGEAWFLGNTYHFAIGQGDLALTPLQVALLTAAVAGEGRVCQPHLAANIHEPNLNVCRDLGGSRKNWQLVKEGMIEACRPGGTGFPFFNSSPPVGCKTGTAEVGDGTDDSHAWFTLFVPAEQPRLVVTVFVERGGSGAYVAAPLAKQVVEFLAQEKKL